MSKGPLIAYVLVFLRRRIPQQKVRGHPDGKRQINAILHYATVAKRTVMFWSIEQTTYRGTRFHLTPNFLLGIRQASDSNGDVVVADAIALLGKLSAEKLGQTWKELRQKHPTLISALHHMKIGAPELQLSSLRGLQLQKSYKKKLARSAAPVPRNRMNILKASSSGVKSIKVRRNNAAAVLAPVLSDIIKNNPDITQAAFATELNDRGISAARGGLWHASSVRNLLHRCRGLGLLPGN